MKCPYCDRWMIEKRKICEMNKMGGDFRHYGNVKYPISDFTCECGAKAEIINGGSPRFAPPPTPDQQAS